MHGLAYHVDLVLVVDGTASMKAFIRAVKRDGRRFPRRLAAEMEHRGRRIAELRVRLVTFRDVRDHGRHAIEQTYFYEMPAEEQNFENAVQDIQLLNGRTYPESGLVGLAVAVNSRWTRLGDRRRHVVCVWSDDEPHSLESEQRYLPPELRAVVPPTLDALTDIWEGALEATGKRLLVFAPGGGAWKSLAENWSNCLLVPSRAGRGLEEQTTDMVVATIANSI